MRSRQFVIEFQQLIHNKNLMLSGIDYIKNLLMSYY